jgi:rhodanese-related sulfurtransferase
LTREPIAIPPILTAGELSSLLAERPDVRLLDVRTPAEFESVHIRGAYNVPLDVLGEHAAEICASVDAPVVLVCQSGRRARQAEDALRHAEMANVHVLDGGIAAWLQNGGPVLRGAQRLSLERQVRIAAGSLAAFGGLLALALNPLFAVVPAAIGGGLVFAGATDRCGLAMVLAKLPYNRPATCDVPSMVRALTSGLPPATTGAPVAAARVTTCASR